MKRSASDDDGAGTTKKQFFSGNAKNGFSCFAKVFCQMYFLAL